MPLPLLIGTVVSSGFSQKLCEQSDGISPGNSLLVFSVFELICFVGVIVLLFLFRRRELAGLQQESPLTLYQGYFRGIFYIICCTARFNWLDVGMKALFRYERSSAFTYEFGGSSAELMGRIWTFTIVALLTPIVEELLFRRIMLRGLMERMKPVQALLLTSIVFGVGHISAHGALNAAVAFFTGYVMGWAYIRTGRINTSISLHMTINACALLEAWF